MKAFARNAVGPLCVGLLCSSCTNQPIVNKDIDASAQQVVERIATKCGMPKASWNLIAGRDVTVTGGADKISNTAFICFVDGLQKANPPFRLGFIAEPPPETVQ